MNWKLIIPMVLLAVGVSIPSTSYAGDEGWAALGGFVLGGALLGGHGHHHSRVHREVIIEDPAPRGYYEYRTERVWHPGHYVRRVLECGTVRKRWEPGHYEHRKIKVWVPGGRDYRSHRSYSHRRSRRSSCDW